MITKRLPHLFGFGILSVFVLWLLAVTLVNLFQTNMVFFIVFVFLTAGCLVTVIDVFLTDIIKGSDYALTKTDAFNFIAVFGGAIVTYALHVHTPLCNVLSAGMIGILAALFFPKYQVPIYCGAFVGMSSSALYGVWFFILASVLASMIFLLAKGVFNGFGGKLGTIAFSGALISWAVTRSPFSKPAIPFEMTQMLMIVGMSAIAAILTYTMSTRLKHGPVLASGLVGFFFCAILMASPLPADMATTLSVVAIGASFVGMSGATRFKNGIPMLAAGVVFGLVFIYSDTHFAGAGGKLGTIAFLSVLALGGMMKWHRRNHRGTICKT